MGSVETNYKKAQERLKSSNHMLTVSYPLVEDPKILLSVAKNLLKSAEYAITATLERERHHTNLSYQNTFKSKYNAFIQKIIPTYNLNKDLITPVMELKEIITAHEDSSVEFKRDEKFVMADETYELRTLSEEKITKYHKKIQQLNDTVEEILNGTNS